MYRRVIAALLGIGSFGFGDPAYFSITGGNKLYSEGKYEEALVEYSKAKTSDPKRPEADYNMGAAQFKTGRFKESMASFERSMKEGAGDVKSNSAYNRAAALYASGVSAKEAGELDEASKLLKSAAESYKAVLKEKPADNDARHNLEIALEKLNETEKEKQERDSQSGGKDSREQDNQGEQGQNDKQDKPDSKDGSGKEDKPKDERQRSADKKEELEQGSGAEEKQEMTKEEAERVFSAIESDEKDLRKQIRNQNVKERPKSGKDW